jgi:hypothetical protein
MRLEMSKAVTTKTTVFWYVMTWDLMQVYRRFGRTYCLLEICALLGYYAAPSGNPLPTFRDNVSVPSSRVKIQVLALEDGTDTLSRNVGKGLTLDAA